MLSESYKDVD